MAAVVTKQTSKGQLLEVTIEGTLPTVVLDGKTVGTGGVFDLGRKARGEITHAIMVNGTAYGLTAAQARAVEAAVATRIAERRQASPQTSESNLDVAARRSKLTDTADDLNWMAAGRNHYR